MLQRTWTRHAASATSALRRHTRQDRSTTSTHYQAAPHAAPHVHYHTTLVARADRQPPQTYAVHARAAHYTTLPPDYGTLTPRVLELWDTEDLDKLEKDLAQEREKLFKIYEHAKLEKRRVVWRNAEFDLKRIGNVEATIRAVRNNPHREW